MATTRMPIEGVFDDDSGQFLGVSDSLNETRLPAFDSQNRLLGADGGVVLDIPNVIGGKYRKSAVTTLGDSRLAQAWYGNPVAGEPRAAGYNFLPLTRAISMGRLELRPECSFAVSGWRTDQYLASGLVAQALATDSYWLITGGVANDVDQRSDSEDYWTVYIKPVVEAWTATGRKAIIQTETGGTAMAGVAAKINAVNKYNAAVRRYCAENSGRVYLLDVAELARSSTASMAFKPDFTGDGIHINLMKGSYALAQKLVSIIGNQLPDQNYLPVVPDEVYANGAVQWFPNPLWLTTTGGNVGTRVTGTVPAGISSWVGDTSVSCAVSTVAGDYGNDLVLAFTASGAGVMRLSMDLTGVAAENAGDKFRLVCESEVDSGHANLSGLPQLHMQYSRGGVSSYSCAAELQAALFGAMPTGKIGPVVLDTGDITIPQGARNWLVADL